MLGNKRHHQKRRLFKQRCAKGKEGGRGVPGSMRKVTSHTEAVIVQMQSVPRCVP